MSTPILNSDRKREAGRIFVSRCEAGFQVHGPTALSRVTNLSKSWWSKLESGKGGRFPDWSFLDRKVFKEGTPDTVRRQILSGYREAWAYLHESQTEPTPQAAPFPSLSVRSLAALRDLAAKAARDGACDTALQGLELLEAFVTKPEFGRHSRDRAALLVECVIEQSYCHSHLGNHDAAIETAQRALSLVAPHSEPELYTRAIHQLGTCYYRAKRWEEALEYLHQADRRYRRLGLNGEVFRTQREAAEVLIEMGDVRTAEPELVRLLHRSEELGPTYRYPTLLSLARCSVALHDSLTARNWLENADRLARRHAGELETSEERISFRENRAGVGAMVAAVEDRHSRESSQEDELAGDSE